MRLATFLKFVLAFVVVATTVANGANAANTAPFSLTFTTRNTLEPGQPEMLEAFANAAQFSDTISFFWNWGDDHQVAAITTVVMLAQRMGFKVVINMSGNLGKLLPPGYQPTFADPAIAGKYINAVAYLASLKPTYLNIYSEVNLLATYSPSEYSNYQKIYANAYRTAKAASPSTLIGTSYVDVLWVGKHQQALTDQLSPHDFIGITSYPFNQFLQVSDIPGDWYSQWRTVYPNERLLFTEIGWSSAPAPLSPVQQALFVAALPRLMQNVSPEVIAYVLQYDGPFNNIGDLTPAQWAFYEFFGADPVTLFDQFNHLGLFTADGQPKPAWYAARNLDFNVGR